MKKHTLLTLLLATLLLLACEDEVINNNDSLGYITGSSSRQYYTASFDDQMGYIDKNGDQVFNQVYTDAQDFYNDFAAFGETQTSSEIKYGYINTKGEVVIPATFGYATEFSKDGFAIVSDKRLPYAYDSAFYFINQQGERLCEDNYYSAHIFNENLAAVQYTKDGKYQFINTLGLPEITTGYDEAQTFINGIAAVKNYGYYGFIDKNGDEVLPLRYKNTTGIYTDGFIGVSDNYGINNNDETKWFFITLEGKNEFKNNSLFDDIKPFFEELAAVKIDEQWRFINTSGEYAFEGSFDDVSSYSEGLAAVHDTNDLWGYINSTGEFSILSQFLYANDFINGIAKVIFIDNTWGYVDKTGDKIWRSTEETNTGFSTRTLTNKDKTNQYIQKAIRLK